MASSYEQVNDVSIWWFPPDFSQSRFGDYQESGSNSCTLISLLIADKINKTLSFSQEATTLPSLAWDIIGKAINDGNKVYHDLISGTLNLNIPDAISAIISHEHIDFQLEEWFYTQVFINNRGFDSISMQLSHILQTSLKIYQQPYDWEIPSHLFAALIADCRTVIICLDLRTSIAAFVDPHQHGEQAGLVFAHVKLKHLDDLMYWYITMLDDIYASHPDMIEIAFLSSLNDVAVRIPPAFDTCVYEFDHSLIKGSEKLDCLTDSEEHALPEKHATPVLSQYYLTC
ncbi:uncharacterized protein LOC117790439 [Drosophila innubila]|uniref:uncharacterized protein LOC117790439 n=1 Tax=Drosophila innubila TaxID=198719 RepID=UPI00148BB107|nr:uncharacterized protein LOC117790439 [Drosophila innubila]